MPSVERSCWVFSGPRRPIVVTGLEPLLPYLSIFLLDWPYKAASGRAPRQADIRVQHNGGKFRILNILMNASNRETISFEDPVEATRALTIHLHSAFVSQLEQAASLHAAAVDSDAGLVLLIGKSYSGKSSLALHLAMRGQLLFGDDRIIVSKRDESGPLVGTCLGRAPKVRLPLPTNCDPKFRHFVESHMVFLDGEHYAVLHLPPSLLARFGAIRDVATIIAFERRDDLSTRLTPASRASILCDLLECAHNPQLTADRFLDMLTGWSASLPSYRLRYSNSAEAAAFLAAELGFSSNGAVVPEGPD